MFINKKIPASPYTVRTAVLADSEIICDFFHAQLPKNFPLFSAPALAQYLQPWNKVALEQRIQHSQGLILTLWQHQELIGLLSGTDSEGGVATIIWLFIDYHQQNQGAGSELFKQACSIYKARHCHKIKLTAPTLAAKTFYLKQGMQEEGFHPKHWWNADFWSLGLLL